LEALFLQQTLSNNLDAGRSKTSTNDLVATNTEKGCPNLKPSLRFQDDTIHEVVEGVRTLNEKIPIRAVVFDYGKVLARAPLVSDVQAMAGIFNVTVQRFEELYWKSRLAYDRGDLDVVSYWTAVGTEAGKSSAATNGKNIPVALAPATIEQLIEIDTRSWSRPDEATVEWAVQLRRAGLELAVLSNMPLELSRRLVATCQ
jgi:hypothetical protein